MLKLATCPPFFLPFGSHCTVTTINHKLMINLKVRLSYKNAQGPHHLPSYLSNQDCAISVHNSSVPKREAAMLENKRIFPIHFREHSLSWNPDFYVLNGVCREALVRKRLNLLCSLQVLLLSVSFVHQNRQSCAGMGKLVADNGTNQFLVKFYPIFM